MAVSVAFCQGIFLAGNSALRGMECIHGAFTSYISSGRCTVMENFSPPCLLQGFVCGYVVIKISTLDTRGHTEAENSIQAIQLGLGKFQWKRGSPFCVRS